MSTSITIQRRVQWIDTDAAGIWHHSTVTRWLEEAEVELHRKLGIVQQTFGVTPRVHLEYSFHRALSFDDEADITLDVDAVGDTSVTYRLSVAKDGEPVVTGKVVAVLIDRVTRDKRPWPDDLRQALTPMP